MKRLLIIILITSNAFSCFAQSNSNPLDNTVQALNRYAAKHVTEKIHLHFDRFEYDAADTIWFKAYVFSGEHHAPSSISGVLYAELINERDSILTRLTLQVDSGLSNGNFIIPGTCKSGIYHIRAYTNFMRNESEENFFDRLIVIHGSAVISAVTSTSSIVKTAPAMTPVTLANPIVQFFPEGGDLVEGIESKVAVKATEKNGASIELQGEIIDDQGNKLTTFNTQHAGMGQFLIKPLTGKKYSLKVINPDGSINFYELPKAKQSGFTLALTITGEGIGIKISANETLFKAIKGSKFYLLAQSLGKYYFASGDELKLPTFTAYLPKNRFPTGIVQFTLFSQNGEPLNERILFIRNTNQLDLSINTQKQVYAPKENVKISLSAINGMGKPVNGSFSVSVTQDPEKKDDENFENTIFTDLLLTSDLKGPVENPNYYFINSTDKTQQDLDLLMLTQGYRRYEWKKILTQTDSPLLFEPQKSLSLSGILTKPDGKPVRFGKVRLSAIGERIVKDTVTNENGLFTFTNTDFNEDTKIVLTAKDDRGKNNVKIAIIEPSYPAVEKSFAKISPLFNAVTKPAGSITSSVLQLNEVKVNYKKNPVYEPTYTDNMRYSSNLNGPGNADQVILGDQLAACPVILECLKASARGITFGKEDKLYSTRALLNHIIRIRPMVIFVDGVMHGEEELKKLSGDDVYSVEILISINYLSMYGSNAANGAVIITLKHGSTAISTSRPDGLITYNFKGYQKERQFYSPQYLLPNTTYGVDDRKTIYWNPNIVTDASGNTSFSYFNGDGKGTYRVVIEGIDINGALGRQVFRYQVK